jgi:predicted ATPase
MPTKLAAHDQALAEEVVAHGGLVFKHTGDGICAVFASAGEAVMAAVDAQRRLELPVRMAVHTGEAVQRGGDYFGVALSRCARLMEVGHGGQVLLAPGTAAVARLGPEIGLRDLGEHRLRDLSEPARIFQVLAPGVADEFPDLRSLDAVRHNLPVLRSSFVGRELELTEVCERLLAGQILTLTGVGGCGKTRLALEAAARLTDRFPQGTFFADLAVVTDPDLVGQAVAAALGLQLVDTSTESLAGYLAGRRTLVVLDNCEHVLDVCAVLVGGLLSRCRELHILVTSREPLGVEGEQVFRVPSLNLETDAIRLFADRARAAGSPFDPDQVGPTVAEICRRLDGIPLAIELAAARTTHLAPAQILERLSDRFRLLTGGRRGVQRQQTLAAAIDWSYDLLTDAEQTLFRQLAVFRGSFSLPAVEEICRSDAVDLLGSLVSKSLVNVHQREAVPRYRLLETVRLYAEERLLASGEAAELRSAHRDWLLAWLESLPLDELVWGRGDRLIANSDNLSAALDWSLENDRLDLIARMASRMLGFWWLYARVGEMGAWWGVLADRLADLPDGLRAQALLVGVEHATVTGDFEAMQTLSADVLAIAEPDSWVAAWAWMRQALYWTYGDPERGRHCIEQGCECATSARVPELERTITAMSVNLLTGDEERDDELGGRAILDSLLATLDEDSPSSAFTIIGIAAALGDTRTAGRLALTFLTGEHPFQRYSQQFLAAVIAIGEGRIKAASEHLRAQVAIVREHALPLGDVSCLIGWAALAAMAGDYERASRLLASARSATRFPFRTPVEVLVYRQTARSVRDALDRATSDRCRTEGARTSVNDALDAELARLDATSSTGAPPGSGSV